MSMRALLAAALLALFAAPAYADDRPFVWTYDADTPAQGEREVEYWLGAKDLAHPTTLAHKLSFEYGLTDRWMLEPYFQFNTGGAEAFAADSVKLESRYRFLDQNGAIPSAAAYLEYEYPFAQGDPQELEGKLIFTDTIGGIAASVNGIATKHFAYEPVEFGYAGGLTYWIGDNVALAAETTGEALGTTEAAYHVGPTLYLKGQGMHLALGTALGLGGQPHKVQAIAGVEF